MPIGPEAASANTVLRVDGGMTASDWTMQRLADLLGSQVDRPVIQETTALGAAYLAGLKAGVFPPPAPLPTVGGSTGVLRLTCPKRSAPRRLPVGAMQCGGH